MATSSVQHPMETAASNTAEWIEKMSDRLADRLSEGGRAPFAAPTSTAERLRYYNTPVRDGSGRIVNHPLFNEDGSPNQPYRASLMARVGPQRFADAIRFLVNHRQDTVNERLDGDQPEPDSQPAPELPEVTDPYGTP